MSKIYFFILVFISSASSMVFLLSCAHAQKTQDSEATVSVVANRQPAAVLQQLNMPLAIDHKLADLSLDIYDLPIEAYKAGTFSADEKVDVVVVIEPSDSSIADPQVMNRIIQQVQFHGILIVLSDDPSGSHFSKLLAKTNSLDIFFSSLMSEAANFGWPSEVKSIVLVGFGAGASNLSALSVSHSNYLKSKLAAIGLFDAVFSKNSSVDGVVKISSTAPAGLKMYLSATNQFQNSIETLADQLEASVPQTAMEEIADPAITHDSLLGTCLPKFLLALTRDPFIQFRCVGPEAQN